VISMSTGESTAIPARAAADPASTGEPRITPELIATARRLLALHEHVPGSYTPVCLMCLKGWPCPDRRWAQRQLRRASLDPRDSPVSSDEVGGGG